MESNWSRTYEHRQNNCLNLKPALQNLTFKQICRILHKLSIGLCLLSNCKITKFNSENAPNYKYTVKSWTQGVCVVFIEYFYYLFTQLMNKAAECGPRDADESCNSTSLIFSTLFPCSV